MNKALWKKCLSESVILFAACAVGTAAFAWFRVHIVGEVDTTSFQKILDLLPKEWLNFTSVDIDWLISYVGRTAMTLDEPFLVMLIAIWAIVRGSDIVSGEISRGTMEMMLSQPVSRKNVFLIHTAVTVLGVLMLVLITWFSMWVAVQTTVVEVAATPTNSFWNSVSEWSTPWLGASQPVELVEKPMVEFVNAAVFAPGMINLLMLGLFITGLATLFSSIDQYRWRTLGVVVAIYMVCAMIKILAMSSETFRWTNWLTFFSLYEPELAIKLFQNDPASLWAFSNVDEAGQWRGFGPLGHNLLLFAGGMSFFVIGLAIFRRRDISAPL